MEPAKAEESISREELEKALSGCGLPELQEMGRRIAKSQQQFQEMLGELQVEQDELRDEKQELNETISTMMKEMQKLHIGSGNITEPQLDEGPLDFVGRLWEKVKPRNSAVVVSEHVGEIRKPEDGPLPNALQEQGKQVAQKVLGALGPLWQRAEGLVKDARGELEKHVRQERQQPRPRRSKEAKERKRAEKLATTGVVAAGVSANAPDADVAQAGGLGVTASPEPAPAEAAAEPAAQAEAPAAAAVEDPTLVEANQTDEAAAAEISGAAEDQISSTILIEAQLKIDDGSIHMLHVKAADRCKEVAHRFVQEHSLKAWFEDPLTAWLKKVENDADKFPVKIEADLMEIRKQHSKHK